MTYTCPWPDWRPCLWTWGWWTTASDRGFAAGSNSNWRIGNQIGKSRPPTSYHSHYDLQLHNWILYFYCACCQQICRCRKIISSQKQYKITDSNMFREEQEDTAKEEEGHRWQDNVSNLKWNHILNLKVLFLQPGSGEKTMSETWNEIRSWTLILHFTP